MSTVERNPGAAPVSTPAFTEVRYHPYQPGDSIQSLKVRKSTPSGCVKRLDDCLESAWKVVKNFFIRLFRFVFCCCNKRPEYVMPQLNLERVCPEEAIPAMRENWRALGEKKWMERIDGDQHKHGKYVFDKGLHGGSVEPGFVVSYEENVVPLIEAHLGMRTTTAFILELHRAACWHFDGSMTDTLMGLEKVGVFRDTDDEVYCTYTLKEGWGMEDWQEFLSFTPSLGKVKWVDEDKKQFRVSYKVYSREEIEAILNLMLDGFYAEVQAKGAERRDKIRACAKLAKFMDWLHTTRDGSMRIGIDTLQKHLTEFVGHPMILEDPHMCAKLRLEKLVDYIEEGLKRWERERTT